jgi:hypothetical protein
VPAFANPMLKPNYSFFHFLSNPWRWRRG